MICCTCVKCGAPATEGSLKHPYCKRHFREAWNNDYSAYFRWLYATHD